MAAVVRAVWVLLSVSQDRFKHRSGFPAGGSTPSTAQGIPIGEISAGLANAVGFDRVGHVASDRGCVDLRWQVAQDLENGQQDAQEDLPIERHGSEPPSRMALLGPWPARNERLGWPARATTEQL